MNPAYNLLCTVGTSIFSNINQLKSSNRELSEMERNLVSAYDNKNFKALAEALSTLNPEDRLCGAEINSIESMIKKGYIHDNFNVFFFHSETEEGRAITSILKYYYESKGNKVKLLEVKDLIDREPHKFRTKGLRNLIKQMCKVIREHSPKSCAINATGGFKAQIAIAVMLGQAIEVPVYYKFELFPEIISFPPMPIALDLEYWIKRNDIFYKLANSDIVECKVYDISREGIDESSTAYKTSFCSSDVIHITLDGKLKSLIEITKIEGKTYAELSPAGQIFHEILSEKFEKDSASFLPPPASEIEKKEPKLEKSGHVRAHKEIYDYLKRLTRENSFVIQCKDKYFNPDLPSKAEFYLNNEDEIEGTFSDGTYCVKFIVLTTAGKDKMQKEAALAALNNWLYTRYKG